MNKIKSLFKSGIMLLKAEKKVPIPYPVDTNKLLQGKVALITGGSGGIGFAMAQSFLKSGCKVIFAGTSEEKLKNCLERIGGGHDKQCNLACCRRFRCFFPA